ncbi:DUF305 domain-containing protein [Streptomyces sp. NPDC052036]|uniref:DUF305 domain-containing protein n=1 Tax=Streptomyces sp. NPDC052036 TaxID=3155171 RepID=UPI0034176959
MATRRSLVRRTPLVRRTAALAAAATAAIMLAACGGTGDSASPSSSASSSSGHSGHDMGSGTGSMSSADPSASAPAAQGGHNAYDVTFAQEMIPHHRQAVTMAGLASSRAKSQQVKNLAAKIEKAQDPEIETMSGWLRAWGEKVPSGVASAMEGGMPGMDHAGSSMPGMMSDADLDKLAKLSGDAFDTAFLKMMVGHHQGALAMARTEQAKGAHGPARAMAQSIVTSQSAEITEMNRMLGRR